MSPSDVAMWVQTAVIVFGFILAWIQFARWREEIAHNRRVDLAMKIGEATYHFQEGFKIARNPFGRYKKEASEPQSSWQDVANVVFGSGEIPYEDIEYDRTIRLKKVFDPLTEMRVLIWQASLIFDPSLKPNMDEIFKEFEDLYWTFADAFYDRDMGMPFTYGREEAKNITGSLGAKDPNTFEDKIDVATERMREAVKKITLGHKTKYDLGEDWRANI